MKKMCWFLALKPVLFWHISRAQQGLRQSVDSIGHLTADFRWQNRNMVIPDQMIPRGL
jgi:hypothetical protein